MSAYGNEIVVTGLGMASSLGGVIQACAAARAGIVRPRSLGVEALDIDDMGATPVVGHPASSLTDGFRGIARWTRLGAAALGDLLHYAQPLPERSKTGCLLLLPGSYLHDMAHTPVEQRPSTIKARASWDAREEPGDASFWAMLSRFSGLELPEHPRAILRSEHHGFTIALQRAMELLRERTVEACLVGAIDSLVERETVELLAELRLLKSAESPVGLMPGEAAAFCLLERRTEAHRRSARIEAILEPPVITCEDLHRFSARPTTGEALAKAMEAVSDGVAAPPIGRVLHNLNGEVWRAMEWGSAMARLPRHHPARALFPWIPAECFGDAGAATGAIALCMGVRAFVRQYARTQRILVSLSSYEGQKGAFVLGAPKPPLGRVSQTLPMG